nr:ankyrin repeat domain-containing protein [Chloroflexota bacterium]
GETWWLHREGIEAAPPTEAQVRFVEAVGLGDVHGLNAFATPDYAGLLRAPLACGLTPVQLAVRTLHPESVEWLMTQGVQPDVVSAWDLGWKDYVRALLARTPELASRREGRGGVTPLHEAVRRDDAELARVVLSADPDLEIQDGEFHSTPLGWARHMGRDGMARLIEAQA